MIANSINFNESSPDTGEADIGFNSGTFSYQSGSYAATQNNDFIYYTIGRGDNAGVYANQTIAFNVSLLASNSSIKITTINGTMAYCHTKTQGKNCTGVGAGNFAQGTNRSLNIFILNSSSGSYVDIGDIQATSTNTKTISKFGLNNKANMSEFINSSGFINIMFEFSWNGSGKSAFLNDHVNLTLTYDSLPFVALSSPKNNTEFVGIRNITFECNTTDDNGLSNVTLYHNINGTFVANQTINISGTSNSTQFSINKTNYGNYNWNCLASDNAASTKFAPLNNTFSVLTNLTISSLECMPSTSSIGSTVTCNATINNEGVNFSVVANVTKPNASVISQIVNNMSSNYYFTFSNTDLEGNYSVLWNVTDITNNSKNAASSFFITNSSIPQTSPIPQTGSSSGSTIFEIVTLPNESELKQTQNIQLNISNKTEFDYTSYIKNSELYIQEMESLGIPTKKALVLFGNAKDAYDEKRFEDVMRSSAKIQEIRNSGILALELIDRLKDEKPKVLTGFVVRDFLNEDFDSAINKARHLEGLTGFSLFLENLNSTGFSLLIPGYVMILGILVLILYRGYKHSAYALNKLVNQENRIRKEIMETSKRYAIKIRNKRSELKIVRSKIRGVKKLQIYKKKN